MSWEAWFTLFVITLVIAILVRGRKATDVVMMGGLTLLLLAGVITPAQALSGLSNEGMVIIAVLYVVVVGLKSTGAIHWLSNTLLGKPKSLAAAQTRVMVPVIALSAFINNTPVAAMMIPAIADWAKRLRFSVSKLMIPLSYAAILGGTCSLIGSSTNLIVNGMLIQSTDYEGFALFDLAWVGVPCALVGFIYVLIASRYWLPERKSSISLLEDVRQYTIEMIVDPEGPLIDKTVEQAGLRHLSGMYLIEVERDGQILPAISPVEKLKANDRLIFAGVVDSIVDLQNIRGLNPATNQVFKLDTPRSERTLIEAVVADANPMVGKSIRDGRFRSIYNAAIIAVTRNGAHIKRKIGDIVLKSGDTLLVEAHPGFIEQQRNSKDFLLISKLSGAQFANHERAPIAISIFIGMVVVVALGLLSMLKAALLAAGLMIITRCTKGYNARQTIDWQVLITIAASIGIGQALNTSGAANAIASSIIQIGDDNAWISLSLVFFITALFSAIITNNAAGVLMFPIALAVAQSLGVSVLPFAIIIMIGASASFATPLGYQTNLMVFGPGGYRFSDYMRMGLPLTFIIGIISVCLAPIIWPL
ncbi:MAG: SLC13 family permease [Gammaproteobacteria bacterium]